MKLYFSALKNRRDSGTYLLITSFYVLLIKCIQHDDPWVSGDVFSSIWEMFDAVRCSGTKLTRLCFQFKWGLPISKHQLGKQRVNQNSSLGLGILASVLPCCAKGIVIKIIYQWMAFRLQIVPSQLHEPFSRRLFHYVVKIVTTYITEACHVVPNLMRGLCVQCV